MHSNVNLLPHLPSIIIKDLSDKLKYLSLMKYILEDMYVALRYFRTNQLNKFDAHVGETSCQIRAYKILLLKKNRNFNQKSLLEIEKNLLEHYTRLKKVIEEYESYLSKKNNEIPQKIKNSITLIDFFKSNDLFMKFSDDFVFVFLSYFLDYFKICDSDGISISINTQKICENLNISSNYASQITKHFQKILSLLSCDFIFKLSSELPETKKFNTILANLCIKDKRGRAILPCYYVTEIILLHMIKTKLDLVIAVNMFANKSFEKILLVFKPNKNDFEFSSIQNPNSYSSKPSFVISGVTSFKLIPSSLNAFVKSITKVSIKEIILANTAAHPQYTGDIPDELKSNPFFTLIAQEYTSADLQKNSLVKILHNKFVKMKRLAMKLGCSIENQKLFLIKHIYCDVFQNWLGHHENLS